MQKTETQLNFFANKGNPENPINPKGLSNSGQSPELSDFHNFINYSFFMVEYISTLPQSG